MPGVRAEMLLAWMELIDAYTLRRALDGLTQEQFAWKPHPGAWGVARRGECTTPDPLGAAGGEWVIDNDWAVVMASYEDWQRGVPTDDRAVVEPMATIGWLLNHVGAAPGLAATLQLVGGPTPPTPEVYGRMWGHTIVGTADEAVARVRDGWTALGTALSSATDEMLERRYEGYPRETGFLALSALLNEVSHHGTQICMLRDLHRQSSGR